MVDVRLTVYRGPRISVTFDGDEVPNATVEDLVPVAREASVDEDLLEDADLLIANYLRSLGYRNAEVQHTRNGVADEILIVFEIAPDMKGWADAIRSCPRRGLANGQSGSRRGASHDRWLASV